MSVPPTSKKTMSAGNDGDLLVGAGEPRPACEPVGPGQTHLLQLRRLLRVGRLQTHRALVHEHAAGAAQGAAAAGSVQHVSQPPDLLVEAGAGTTGAGQIAGYETDERQMSLTPDRSGLRPT